MSGLLCSAQMGLASGLRSMAAPSQLSRHLATTTPNVARGPIAGFMARKPVRSFLQLAALGEMIADKLPTIPDRTDPGPLVGRVFFGGVAGGVCTRTHGESVGLGVVAGGAAAVAGAFAGYHLRRALVHDAGVPDLFVALCEDAVALVLARRALRP